MKWLSYSVLFLVLLTQSCSKDEPKPFSGDISEPVVTGLTLYDYSAQTIVTKGVPNDQPFDDPAMKAVVYPSPNRGYFTVSLKFPAQNSSEEIWVVPACNQAPPFKLYMDWNNIYEVYPTDDCGNGVSQTAISANLVNIGGAPIAYAKGTLSGQSGNTITFDIHDKARAGAYRVYFKIGDKIAWQNIIVVP